MKQLLAWIQHHQRLTLIGSIVLLVPLLTGGILLATQSDDDDPFAPDAVTDPAFPSLSYGVHAFLWWNPTARTIDLDNVRLMRFGYIKQRFSWANIQPAPDSWVWTNDLDQGADGVVDEIEHRGLQLVARLDGPPDWALVDTGDDPAQPPVDLAAWGTYCGTLASRYQGRIAAYQVWNEPNLSREWFDLPPNAASYVKVLQVCSDAIRTADPDAIIISAGLAPTGTLSPEAIPDTDFLRQMYDAGAADYFDVLGLNAPGYKAPPEMSPDEAEEEYGHRWMCFRHVEDMRRIMVENGDAEKQVALLEVGWTIDPREDSPYHWHAVTESEQAAYLVGAYRYAAQNWRPWIGLMTTIFLADFDWDENDEEYWWSINTAGYLVDSGQPWAGREAYYTLARMEQYIDDEVIPAYDDPSSTEATHVETIVPRTGDEPVE
ncbi:MAG: cellulase family glycosylhydrolase [Chloroflexi bacterium]|nr:cellulase family glycosylhydrolase [Chloroflexota bacterium]